MIKAGRVVGFKNLKNWRGYPATGEVVNVSDGVADVNAYGLIGPGSESGVRGVPLDELDDLENQFFWQWMRGEAEYPGPTVAANVLRDEIDEWERWTSGGMDIVASACLDNVVEIIKAMRDL